MTFDWAPIGLSVQLATITVLILAVLGIPLAHWLAYSRWKGKVVVEVLVSLPLVLPPTVLGFYLLVLLSPNSTIGRFFSENLGWDLVFSFPGLVIGSVIYSLPFMVNPLVAGFRQLPPTLRETAFVFGKSPFKTLISILLPNIRPALLTAMVMTFAHTLGEFGVVLMVGGGIPGETKVTSIAIFEEVEMLNYNNAHIYSGILLGVTFCILLAVFMWNGRKKGGERWESN